MVKRTICVLFVLLSATHIWAQKPSPTPSGVIQQKLKKLNVLGTVLYVAAHPDDENTAVITYFANGRLFRTAYLSATRGDGGQNLIGSEIREELGIIRTQELLAARRTDGGQQFFSRANDFGYSKHPDETLTIWEKEKVLSDFVRVIRKFKPDVIITRFNLEPGTTHGHHTTSAMLAKEAFTLAGDADAFPEQLGELDTWQPKKIFWNTSQWFYRWRGIEFDPSKYIDLDIGLYNPDLGLSYNEISALSRSMHKSQGFGSVGVRGKQIEYFEQWGGEKTDDLMGGIDVTWGRVSGAEPIQNFIQQAIDSYQPNQPARALGALYNARLEIMKLPDQHWKEVKLNEIDEVIAAISGLYMEVIADDNTYVSGDSATFNIEVISRVNADFELVEVVIEPMGQKQEFNQLLGENEKITADLSAEIPNIPFSHPYWLNDQATLGMYHVENPRHIGKPENDPVFVSRFLIKWEEQFLEFEKPIVYKRRDRVEGELYRPVEITPQAMVNLGSEIIVFGDSERKKIEARVIAGKDGVSGTLELKTPEGWQVDPKSIPFELASKGEEAIFSFNIQPPMGASEAILQAQLTTDDGTVSTLGRTVIDYSHIPFQTLFPPARTKLVKLDLKIAGNLIGYIEGAGDAIPDNLEQIGYQVDKLEKDEVTADNLLKYDAVVLGVRAFNTVDWLSYKNQELFDYAAKGGTVVVQYNTTGGLNTNEVAPYKIKLSRDRVSVENAEVRVLEPNHPVLNFPNKITENDFNNWVQERGLYFPNEWDEKFTAVLSSNDPGEPERNGGLLVAQHGEGYYIYSGYSWFRELPAGVPGAYRLFVNLLSIGQNEQQ